MTGWRALWIVICKELRCEWQSRVRLNATLVFSLLVLLMFSFAIGPAHRLLVRVGGGFLWLALLFASTMSLAESMRLEYEDEALDGLRLMGLDLTMLFLGKAMVNALYLFVLGLILIPVAVGLYGLEFKLGVVHLLLVLACGSAAISIPGTLYAAVAIQLQSSDVLLPLLLFPVLVPVLLGAVKATGLVFQGDPMGQWSSWMMLLLVFVVVYGLLASVLFGRIVEA